MAAASSAGPDPQGQMVSWGPAGDRMQYENTTREAIGTAGDRMQEGAIIQLQTKPWISTNLFLSFQERYPNESAGEVLPALFLPEGTAEDIVSGNYMKWMVMADTLGKIIAMHFESYPLLIALQQGGPTPDVL